MKKSLALVLALIMVMGCMSFAAAEGERTVTLNRSNLKCLQGICDVKSVDEKNGTIALTYFITEEPQWKNEPGRYNGVDFIRLETTLGVPCEGAAFVGTHKDNWIAASSGYQFDGPFLKTSVSNGYHDKMTLNWYGTKEEEGKQVADTSNVLYTDEITYDIIPAYNPVPADKDRIAAIGASINHGSVAFDAAPADGTAITVSKPNEYASSYQINNDSNITSGTSANINIGDLSAGASQDYTIKWYAGEGGNEFLVGTDTLTVSVRPEGYYSFTPYDTPVVIEEPNGAQTNITPEDGFLPTASVELKYNLNKKEWEEVFYKYGEDNRIFLPLWFYLPGSAKDYFKIEYFGNESRPVEEDLKFLKDAQYFNANLNDGEGGYGGYKYFHDGLVIAQVKYEGNNVIIEPQSGKVSWLIKWLDDNNVDHFHRVTFDVNISSSDTGIKLTNASPANDRVKFDTQAGANGSYSDGTVRYMLGEGFTYGSNGKGETVTKLVKPYDNATSATVNGELATVGADNAIEMKLEARNNQSMTEAFTVRWLDAGGNTIKTERITISNCPTGAGVPWQNYWAPIDSKRINVQDKNLTSFFSYDDGKLLFKVDNNNASTLNADKLNELSQNDLIYEITPPEGAAYFKMSGQHSPLYDTYFADSTKQWLEKQPFENCVFDENGAAKPYYYSFGKLFNRTKVEGVYVYTVNNTPVTFADMLVFQWYDAKKAPIKEGDKEGYYFYLIKEPYAAVYEKKASKTAPTTVENPTIVVSDAKDNEILRAEIPIQKAVDPNSNTKYLYMKLKYIDKTTGLEVKPGAAGAEVYLAYPDGMTYYNFKDYTVKLTHYTDENHVKHENVTLEATLIGLKFKTDSFSPFLLEWTPKGSSSSSSSSGGSGGLSGVDITNRTNREILSYRLGGGLLTFRLAGSGDVIVTENGKVVKPDADGWYTVSAGARIVVDYPVMVLPKTGDMPVWRWLLGL